MNSKRKAIASLLAVAALAAGIAFVAASTAVAQVDDAAACAERFGFARNPVPVAKTADGQQVLASVKWGYSPGLCYLVLDDAAVQILRNNPPTGSPQVTTPADRTAADRCHNAHNPNHGFARNPVPVAKTADGQQVLASVKWGYSPGLCYLILDDNAVQALRTNPPTTSSADTLPIPANPHSRVGVGSFHFCYLGTDDTALCPNASQFYGQALTGAPGGQFAAISSGYRHSCGLRNDSTVECWGDDQYGPYLAPDGKFASVSAGSAFSCGLRTTGAIECWGHQRDNRELVNDERLDAPSGQYAAVSAGNNYACGLRTNGTIACWGTHWAETLSPPSGRFTAISAGEHQACGLRVDGTLKCWGSVRSAPGGQFTSVSVGALHSCGIRADGTVECWGRNESGEADAPDGQFTEISAGGFTSCGLRIDQIVFCWGWIKRPFTATVDIHVFYCAAQSAGYSNVDLEREIEALNDNVGGFFESHSAGLVDLNFVFGGVVSPDIQWDQHTIADLYTGRLYGEPCESEIHRSGIYSQLLVLADLEPGNPTGFARIEGETAFAFSPTLEARYFHACSRQSQSIRVRDIDIDNSCPVYELYYGTITHEIGHSVFRLEHNLDCSVMSHTCPDNTRLGCTHLIALGWPHEDACQQDLSSRSDTGNNFTFIQQGDGFNCGLRADGTISCWGDWSYGQTNAPSGTFNSIAVSHHHVCGLRTDGTIVCWGRNNYGQTNAPSGTFTWVQTWPSYSCGLRDNGATECWGDQTIGKVKSYTPGGTLTAIAAGGVHWCALRDDHTIACDGLFPGAETNPPDGKFIAVYSGGDESCGLTVAQKYICWGSVDWGSTGFPLDNPPEPMLTSLVFGNVHACGLRTDQTIACWIWDRVSDRTWSNYGEEFPPLGQFTALTSGGYNTCGLRTDRTIECWGQNAFQNIIHPPEGEFTAIAGNGTFCGLRTDQTIACWGLNDLGQADPPNGQFTAISHAGVHGCGLRTDQSIACWGQNASGETDAPRGRFIAVSAGGQHSCGIRTDRTTVVCWGVVPE